MLHSMIHSLDFEIEGTKLNPNSDYYAFMAYIRNMTAYDSLVKDSTLAMEGFATDVSGQYDSPASNFGWIQRSHWFLENKRPTGKSKILYGKLLHPLVTCSVPVPCGCKIRIKLKLNTSEFVLQQTEQDVRSYDLSIKSMTLLVKIGTLSEPIYKNLLTSWKKERPYKLHYRRYVIVNHSIPASVSSKSITLSHEGNDVPSRLILFFLESDVFTAPKNRLKNPFKFIRKFAPDVYITRISVTLNGQNLDTEQDDMTQDDSVVMYKRFLEVLGFLNTSLTNSISMADFDSEVFLGCYELSMSKNSADPTFVPTTKTGTLTIGTNFSTNLPKEIKMMLLLEYPTTASIAPNGKVELSFPV